MPFSGPGSTPRDTRLALKVDVDTLVGTRQGLPRLMEIMGQRGVKASFYLSVGPDNSGRALKRLVKPGFLAKQLRSGAAGAYGLRTMAYGLLLPGPVIGTRAAPIIRGLVRAGHEVGLHAWDHVFWHDQLHGLSSDRVRRELQLGTNLLTEIIGFRPLSFAAPGWQITPEALVWLEKLGYAHISCGRGRAPFRPKAGGRVLSLLEIPSTLPTMDEVLGREGVRPSNVDQAMWERIKPGELNVFTLHGEVEGRELAPAFARLLDRCLAGGVRLITMLEAAQEALEGPALPGDSFLPGEVPGRAGTVAWQASALGEEKGPF